MSYIVSIVAVVLAALFAVLGKWWGGFAYFVLAILLLLSIFWSVWLILKYRTDFKKETEEKSTLQSKTNQQVANQRSYVYAK